MYSCMFMHVFVCSFEPLYVDVYSCILTCTLVYSCVLLYVHVYSCTFMCTLFCSWVLLFAHVSCVSLYPCDPVWNSCLSGYSVWSSEKLGLSSERSGWSSERLGWSVCCLLSSLFSFQQQQGLMSYKYCLV